MDENPYEAPQTESEESVVTVRRQSPHVQQRLWYLCVIVLMVSWITASIVVWEATR